MVDAIALVASAVVAIDEKKRQNRSASVLRLALSKSVANLWKHKGISSRDSF